MATEKDQVAEKPQSLEDFFDKGWAEVEAQGSQETAVKEEAPAQPAKETPCDAPPCVEARKKAEAEAAAKPGGWPKTLKVGGQNIVVNSKRELAEKIAEFYEDENKMVDLGQMSADYTRKRQADAEAEKVLQEKHDNLEAIAARLEKFYAGQGLPPKPAGQPAQPEQVVDEKAKIYEQYGIDPEYADEGQIKLVDDVYAMKQKMARVEAMSDAIVLKEKMAELATALKAEREQYPIEEIMSEDGKQNLTAKQFVGLLQERVNQAVRDGEKNPDINEIGRQVIREIHRMQRQTAKEVEPPTENLSLEKFAERYPKVYAKMVEDAKAKARSEYDAEQANLPPSLRARRSEVSLPKAMGADGSPKTFEDYLDKGMNDPDVIKAFRGD